MAPGPAQIASDDSAVARFFLRSGAGFRLAGERIRRSRQGRAPPADGGRAGESVHLRAERAPGLSSGPEGQAGRAKRRPTISSGASCAGCVSVRSVISTIAPAIRCSPPALLSPRGNGRESASSSSTTASRSFGRNRSRNAGAARRQPCLLVRLVEQSRRARRAGVRLRRHARSRNGRARIGTTPVSAATRRAISSPASAPATSGFTSFRRSSLWSLGKATAGNSPTRGFSVSCSGRQATENESGNHGPTDRS